MAYSGNIVDYLGSGLASARPASLALSPGAIGIYFATDTKAQSLWDGTAWNAVGGGLSNPMTTAGDMIVGGASGTPTRLAVGTNGQALIVTAGVPAWGAVGGTGTVTSVGLSAPALFAVAGSPVTTAGTLALSLATQAANLVFAGPASGAAAAPTMRALVAADLPSSMAFTGTLSASNLSGTNTGDQTITLTGDVTGSGTGSFAASIAAGAVTLAKMANMATTSLLGRSTAGSGAPEVIAIGSGLSLSAGVLSSTAGGGSVTSVSVTTANGVSGTVATATTTPAITLTLGAITPTSVAASGTVTGSNLSGTNTGDQTSVTGNAGTATKLATARTINGMAFDGTANITIPILVDWGYACSDETTALTTGTKVTDRAPRAMTLTKVKAGLTTASSSGLVTIDVKKNGTSIFSTLLTIDATEKTTATAATPAVLSTTSIADDDEITISITVAGTGAAGLKVHLVGSV